MYIYHSYLNDLLHVANVCKYYSYIIFPNTFREVITVLISENCFGNIQLLILRLGRLYEKCAVTSWATFFIHAGDNNCNCAIERLIPACRLAKNKFDRTFV